MSAAAVIRVSELAASRDGAAAAAIQQAGLIAEARPVFDGITCRVWLGLVR